MRETTGPRVHHNQQQPKQSENIVQRRKYMHPSFQDNEALKKLEQRILLLEKKNNIRAKVGSSENETHPDFFCARFTLFLITVVIFCASLFTFGPTLYRSTFNHIFLEALYPISLVSWTVHEHVYAGIQTKEVVEGPNKRLNVCTLDGLHYIVSALCFFLCFVHCVFISNFPYILIQFVNGVVALLPYFFLGNLREALRRHNTHLDDVAVSALKRGMSVLSLMTFLLSEATGCIGLTSPAFEVPRSCQYAVIDSYILNHIAFLNLFDTVIVETGIVTSRTALIQCRPSIPMSIRLCAAIGGILTVYSIALFSTRFSIKLFIPSETFKKSNRTDPTGFNDFEITPALPLSLLPVFLWMIINTVIFCNMQTYLKLLAKRDLKKIDQTLANIEQNMVIDNGKDRSNNKESSTYIVVDSGGSDS